MFPEMFKEDSDSEMLPPIKSDHKLNSGQYINKYKSHNYIPAKIP